MKSPLIIACLIAATPLFAKTECPIFSTTKPKVLLINFDGLGASEFNIKILEKNISQKIIRRCSSKEVHSATFHYGKRGALAAYQCAKKLRESNPLLSISVFGHSFGGGKGVFNFLQNTVKESIIDIENAVTFDPRGYSYRYQNPGNPYVDNFINIYQRKPLRGMQVKGSDFESNVTALGVTHGNLPKTKGDLALKQLRGSLTCANSK